MQFRLEKEYGAPCRFEPITFRYPRWLTGSEEDVRRVSNASGRMQIFDARGNLVVLFQDAFALRWAVQQETRVTFHPVAP
jgi:peptide chain release factor 3